MEGFGLYYSRTLIFMSQESTEHTEREFVSLLTAHQSDLWAFLIAMMPGHPDVADVLQKTNLVLWEKRGSFELGTNFRAWALTVGRFEALKHLKSLRRDQIFVFDDELLDQLADDVEASLPQTQTRLEALKHCLDQLRPQDRELLEHRYSSSEILGSYAKSRGRSVSSLSVTLFRLRALLRQCVSRQLLVEGGHA